MPKMMQADLPGLQGLSGIQRGILLPPGLVAGVDEAGRGCLAGPVTAAAVILSPDHTIMGLDDSKKLTARTREQLRNEIMQFSLIWAVGWASVTEIDRVNILQATFLAMQRAVVQLKYSPDSILVDGNQLPDFSGIPAQAIIGGDGLVPAIAAASILAKTARDALMQRWHYLYPSYGFDRHKGYPSQKHRQIIATEGRTPLHRWSFRVKESSL